VKLIGCNLPGAALSEEKLIVPGHGLGESGDVLYTLGQGTATGECFVKITIDVDKLLKEGRISSEEYARLKSLAQSDTRRLGFNVLVAFGVFATALGTMALVPSGITALVLGAALCAAGVWLRSTKFAKEWRLLGWTFLLVGSITTLGGIYYELPESAHKAILAAADSLGNFVEHYTFFSLLVISLVFLGASILARNGILVVISVLTLSAAVGAATFYGHAEYVLEITKPTITLCLFGVLSFAAMYLSRRVPLEYERLAIIYSYTSLILVNFAFWVGSLWGDKFGHWVVNYGMLHYEIPDWVFAIGWAVGLLAAGAWAVRNNRRWVVNLTTVFAAIHFYTQIFERLGASPKSFLISGLAALGIAFFILRYNQKARVAAESGTPITQ
jgi:hypothetical protein